MISDLVLGFFAITFFILLIKKNINWSLFFLFMGISAFAGGFWHGYFDESNNLLRFLSWSFLALSLLFPAIELYKNNNKIFKLGFIFISLSLLFFAIFYCNFLFMEINAIVIMLGFVLVKSIIKSKKNNAYTFIYTGILISLVSVFFQIKRYSFTEYLNYNDIGHYITIISLLVIYIGANKSLLKS